MVTVRWLSGLLARRRARLLATALGIAVAVSLVASIGAFLSGSTAAMTERAIARVPLDWQVQAAPGADPAKLLRAVASYPGIRSALPVAYATTGGYRSTSAGGETNAGGGLVLGVPAAYRATYPQEFRQYIGAHDGVLIAQQMAANLGVTTGGSVTIERAGLPSVTVRVDGVIDFPAAAQLLGPVGLASGGTRVPPPDDVLVLPLARWHALFDPLAAARPDLVRYQVHAELAHGSLPRDPAGAFSELDGRARNLESRLQGTGIVGNNLAAALDKARGDSLYARIAFLFLGLPGALLAALVTIAIASSGHQRRRRDSAILRARGATSSTLVRLALAETALVGLLGGGAGLAVALVIGRVSFGSASFGAGSGGAALWAAISVTGGLAIAASAIALPAWRDARSLTVSAGRVALQRARPPWWSRFGIDLLALAASIAVFAATGSSGYQLVLAVEGAPQVSVDYWSFAAPLLAWIGIGLVSYRIADLLLDRGHCAVRRAIRPFSHGLAGTVSAGMRRERRPIARALALVTLASCFAASTAAFNTTYRQQAEVDARLTNGADVVVTASAAAPLAPGRVRVFAALPGVASVEPIQHRYAYIGRDLQDLYGVDAQTIVRNGRLQDAFFRGGSAAGLMGRLARTPNGIFVSAEVVHDYQLRLGDRINLRVLDQRTRRPIAIPFTYLGITEEFPTAPKDAYTIANAAYVATTTGDAGIGTFLIQTPGASPAQVGTAVSRMIGAAGTVTDVTSNRKLVASSLTSVELAGLTKVELAYALVLVAAATGLLLGLGLSERRRTFAIVSALGARPRQLGGFIWSETAFVTIGGLALGALAATWMTWMLVKLLTGVFDPPPTSPAIPWSYLAVVGAFALGAVVIASVGVLRTLRRPALETVRDL